MNADLRKTNQRHARRPHRRPLWCFLPRLARKPRDRRRVIELLRQRGIVQS